MYEIDNVDGWSSVQWCRPNGVGKKEEKDKTDSGVGALLPPDEIGASERDLMKHVSSTENKY